MRAVNGSPATRAARIEKVAGDISAQVAAMSQNPGFGDWMAILLKEICELKVDLADAKAAAERGPDLRLTGELQDLRDARR
jgi:hypothetical protein